MNLLIISQDAVHALSRNASPDTRSGSRALAASSEFPLKLDDSTIQISGVRNLTSLASEISEHSETRDIRRRRQEQSITAPSY
jgi:hypothetical protein